MIFRFTLRKDAIMGLHPYILLEVKYAIYACNMRKKPICNLPCVLA